MKNDEVLLSIKNLKQYFNAGKKNEVRAIENISFEIYKGETLGLVGESGCGKSTTGKSIIKLNDITSGEILYEGIDIQKIRKRKDLLKFNKKIQMIFQDPYASLNPRLKVMDFEENFLYGNFISNYYNNNFFSNEINAWFTF